MLEFISRLRTVLLVRLVLANSEISRLRQEVRCHEQDAHDANNLRWENDSLKTELSELYAKIEELAKENDYLKEASLSYRELTSGQLVNLDENGFPPKGGASPSGL